MDSIEIGLWVTGGMLVMVVLGMRVAFAAGMAGFVGLIVIFWSKKDFGGEDFTWALTVATVAVSCTAQTVAARVVEASAKQSQPRKTTLRNSLKIMPMGACPCPAFAGRLRRSGPLANHEPDQVRPLVARKSSSRACCASVRGQAEGGRVGPQWKPWARSAAFTAVTLVPFSSSARISSKVRIPAMRVLALS